MLTGVQIFQNCENPNKGPLPDLYAYLTDSSKANDTKNFIQNLQFFVVHNNMDVAALDMVRRCNCAVGTPSVLGEGFQLIIVPSFDHLKALHLIVPAVFNFPR